MNAQGNSALHMLARETGRKYEDLYAEYHGTMKFWGDDELTAKQTARIQRIRAERAAKKAAGWCGDGACWNDDECDKCHAVFWRCGPDFQLSYTTDEGYDTLCKNCVLQYNDLNQNRFCRDCEPDVDDRDDEIEVQNLEEDMGECPKCDCAVKRCDLAWRANDEDNINIGYYLDICRKCDDDDKGDCGNFEAAEKMVTAKLAARKLTAK